MSAARPRVLSGFALKWIAIVSMLIDHIGSIVLDGLIAPYRIEGVITFSAQMPLLIRAVPQLRLVCEALGSAAFPIFCFLAAEGFLHTRSAKKYALRMLAAALLSEIPYDLARYSVVFSPRLQNVLFTLSISLFTLLALRELEHRFEREALMRCALGAAAILAGMGLAFLVRGEYVYLGVLTVSLLYLLRGCELWRLAGLAPLLIVSPWILLALPPLALYNGRRGRGNAAFFYFFYPGHFLVLAVAAKLLAQRPI